MEDEFLVVDSFLDQRNAEELRESCEGLSCEFKAHQFSFAGQVVTKPGIFEVETCAAACPTSIVERLHVVQAVIASLVSRHFGMVRKAAIKVQRNSGGAFPCHYDNPGPPNRRAVTAILYLTDATESDGGALRIDPFLRQATVIVPRHNRLVCFRSDRCLHSVNRWKSDRLRHAVSFWFDGDGVNQKTTLTKSDLQFPTWDAAADFFQTSPLQRILSRAVYAPEYMHTLCECGFDDPTLHKMLQQHDAAVTAIVRSLRPLIEELVRRKVALPPPIIVP